MCKTVLNNQHNYTYNNQFVGCLCKGETATGSMGNNTISSSVGLCLNCHTTPGLVKRDLKVSLIVSCQASAGGGLTCSGLDLESPPAMRCAGAEWNSSRCYALQASRLPHEYHRTTALWASILKSYIHYSPTGHRQDSETATPHPLLRWTSAAILASTYCFLRNIIIRHNGKKLYHVL